MQRALFVVFTLMLCALGVGASVVLAGGGNSGNSAMCQQNGWQQLQTAAGGSFANQGACVSYASQGGALFHPTVTVTSATCTSSSLTSIEQIFFLAAGFTPNGSLSANIVASDFAGVTTTVSSPPTFDPSGSASGSAAAAFIPPLSTFKGFVIVSDGTGVSVTTPDFESPCLSS